MDLGENPRKNLIEIGAKLYNKKRKAQDEMNTINSQIKSWNETCLEWTEKNNEHLLEIMVDESNASEMGEPGVFKISVEKDQEGFTKAANIKLNEEFYTMICKSAPEEEIKKMAMGQASWVWNNRKKKPEKRVVERLSLNELNKVKRVKQDKPEKQSDDCPQTYEDFMKLPIVKQWNESGL